MSFLYFLTKMIKYEETAVKAFKRGKGGTEQPEQQGFPQMVREQLQGKAFVVYREHHSILLYCSYTTAKSFIL